MVDDTDSVTAKSIRVITHIGVTMEQPEILVATARLAQTEVLVVTGVCYYFEKVQDTVILRGNCVFCLAITLSY